MQRLKSKVTIRVLEIKTPRPQLEKLYLVDGAVLHPHDVPPFRSTEVIEIAERPVEAIRVGLVLGLESLAMSAA